MVETFIKKINDKITEISSETQQITLKDSRYYKIKDSYYPSITFVLNLYPKGSHFIDWIKKVGFASEYIVKKASEEGILVHELIERFLSGEELFLFDKTYNPNYSIEVWQMFLRFVEFYEVYKPKIINQEFIIHSDELGVAGTCDLLCEINDELWLIDFKTSNHLQTTYDLQTTIYGKCFEEIHGKRPDRFGILWLKSSKHGPDKSGKKIQGKGWELYESSRSFEENLEVFKALKLIFDIENPKHEPSFVSFKTRIKK
jgi:hypothetical protein